MLNLQAIYKENNNGTWDATIDEHPYILVQDAPCLESAREMLVIFAAEELSAKYRGRRCNWEITGEEILK